MTLYKVIYILLLTVILWIGNLELSYASNTIEFGPKETKINGSIKYSVVGKYQASFDHFKGKIAIDEKSYTVQSVELEIQVSSIRSNCSWCDKIVCSKRLLYTEKYPEIIFKSNAIIKDGSGYHVRGVLKMHGVEKSMTFPFKANIIEDHGQKFLDLSGNWEIYRKDFGIIWNALLDQGGVLVGNNVNVQWAIRRAL